MVQSNASQSTGHPPPALASPGTLSERQIFKPQATQGLKPRMGVLTSRPGDSDAGYSLKTTGKKHVDFRTGKGAQGPQFKAGQPGFPSSTSVKTAHFFQINNGPILV